MTAYEELGVASTATAEEIHAAYVGLARRFHPDRTSDSDESDGDRMARINAAWDVLADPARRAAYDATLVASSRSKVRDPGPTWTPLADAEVDDVELDDTPTGARPLPRPVTLVPACLVAVGVVLVTVFSIVGVGPMVGIGVALVIAGAVAFVALPVMTMIGAARAERDW